MLSTSDTEVLLTSLLSKECTAQQAIRQLIKKGWPKHESQELVFIALGGSDLIESGSDHVDRYYPSMRRVSDVWQELKK